MLPTEFRAELDALWSEFWPATDIKPLAVIDFINSVFFIRYLEEVQEKKERVASFYNKPVESPVYAEDQQEFRWSAFNQMDKHDLYQLFNRPGNNILNFARSTSEYKKWSRFDTDGTPLVAIPELLANTVRMIANLPAADNATRKEMNNYLFEKMEVAEQKPSDSLPTVKFNTQPKKRRPILHLWNVSVALLIIFISGFAIAYFYFGAKKNKIAAATISNNSSRDSAIIPALVVPREKNKPVVKKSSNKNKNSIAKKDVSKPKAEAVKEKPVVVAENRSPGEIKGKYKIISKAYFHNEPDESTRRNAFVVHWNNSYATINALDEENGFVYVVFRNHQNQTSKGWLRKKDLRPADQ